MLAGHQSGQSVDQGEFTSNILYPHASRPMALTSTCLNHHAGQKVPFLVEFDNCSLEASAAPPPRMLSETSDRLGPFEGA
jgi:hypothetical protein